MRKQFNLQDWLKDKSQKVETRDGSHVVETISVDLTRDSMRVMANFGNNRIVHYYDDGRFWENANSDSDLFIVTPESELSEFESKVKYIVDNLTNNITYRNVMKERFNRGDEDEQIKEYASELLVFARKEIVHNIVDSDLDSLAHKIGYQKEFEAGKAEALRDLPRWERSGVPHLSTEVKNYSLDGEPSDLWLLHSGWKINVKSLEKLPGFKED